VHHPRDPALLLGHLLALKRGRLPLARAVAVPAAAVPARAEEARLVALALLLRHLPGSASSDGARWPVALVAHEDVAQRQDALDVLGRVDDRLVLEDRRDDGVRDGAARRVGLCGEE